MILSRPLCLTVSEEDLGIASLPGSSVGTTDSIISSVTLHAETAVLAASRGKTSSLTVLVDGVDDPVDAGIIADGNVTGVNEDDLEVLVGRILVDPV